MRKLMIAALLAAGSAHADLIVRNDGNWLQLHESQCKSAEVLSLLRDEWKDKFHSASSFANGQNFAACWIENNGFAFVLFDDGDRLVLPLSAFKQEGA